MRILAVTKIGESKIGRLDSRRVVSQVVVLLTCLIIVFGGLTWRASLETCELEYVVSVRHGWIKEYRYQSLLFGVGIQSVDTMYLTQPGKNDVHMCKIR